jgi:hypothetical protein
MHTSEGALYQVAVARCINARTPGLRFLFGLEFLEALAADAMACPAHHPSHARWMA